MQPTDLIQNAFYTVTQVFPRGWARKTPTCHRPAELLQHFLGNGLLVLAQASVGRISMQNIPKVKEFKHLRKMERSVHANCPPPPLLRLPTWSANPDTLTAVSMVFVCSCDLSSFRRHRLCILSIQGWVEHNLASLRRRGCF